MPRLLGNQWLKYDKMDPKFLLSNMLSDVLVRKFNMPSMYALTLSSMIGSYMVYLTLENVQMVLTRQVVSSFFTLLAVAAGGYWYMFHYKPKISVSGKKYHHLSLYSQYKMNIVTWFMEQKPDFFAVANLEYGNRMYRETADLFFPEVNSRLPFHDSIHNVRGIISVGVTKEKSSDDKETKIRYLRIMTESSGVKPLTYFRMIEGYKRNQERECPRLELRFVKLVTDREGYLRNNVVTIYQGEKGDDAERYKKYMLSYFSPLRNKIWKRISTVHYHPENFQMMGQTATCNLLLHGPPGTGKSTLAYRLAVATGRHLISLNLVDYVSRKRQLYKTLLQPCFDDYMYHPSEVIFLFEEFDNTVRYLKEQSKEPEWPKLWHHHAMGSQLEKKKKGSEEEEEEKGEKFSIGNGRDLKLWDLLDILQGSVPIEGAIIVATTNHFDYIHKTMPALVRPGRLTPMHVDYLDWDSLQELTRFYFQQELTIPEVKIQYPTSGIIELAMECKGMPHGFADFQNRLTQLTRISE